MLVALIQLGVLLGSTLRNLELGTYVKTDKYDHIMMAMKTTMTAEGAKFEVPQGTAEENAKLDQSYEHLCKMRDELVTLNIVPPVSEWNKINPNL